jgi:hypothetical protein
MPSYLYVCMCGRQLTTGSREPPRCPGDGLTMRREWNTFAHHRTDMQAHYNHSVGKVISNQAQFRSELHRKGDEMSERLGFAHQYEPVDIRDKEACGVTDDGADQIAKRYGKAL